MKEDKILTNIDFSKWSKGHWSLFSSLLIGFFMWGVIASIAPLFYPSVNIVWFLIAPIIAQLIGDLGISLISDKKLGRKGTFFVTMGLYGSGALIIFLAATISYSYPSLLPSSSLTFIIIILAGIILADLGIEGEVPIALSYASETMPLKLRETMLVLLPNFDNVGAMFAALIAYLTYSISNSYIIELRTLGIVSIILVGIAIVIRYLTPESARWLLNKGKEFEAEKEIEKGYFESSEDENQVKILHVNKKTPFIIRFLFLAIIGVSQYLTYGLMAYIIADYYFKGATVDFIVFAANLGASVAGFVAAILIKNVGSKSFGFASFLGGTLTMVPIILLVTGILPFSMITFYGLLSANMFFSEFGWATRTIFEPVLMPTKSRAFYIGLIRVFPMLSYAASIQLTSSFTELQFVEFNLALWILGAIGAGLWFIDGYDTNYVPIEETSQEVLENKI
ncbi:MFS transporter [Acidianus sulfidivorans JP7]|uniref:MFS transporter n=1 Tax=Acidianus sulfidivorans JP7 TaxID=619593 RepID=A0A2U9IK11_9CREN|nr:MFS transporter [Acidianus sulfidivorans]AWR96325.1 MFS transporter [Acidianus sulfidivorans JP7]